MFTIPGNVSAVIFDHDGTLVNSEPLHLLCWQDLLGDCGDLLTEDLYRKNLMGIPSIESAKWLVKRFGLHHTPEFLLDKKMMLLSERQRETPPPLCDGVLNLLNLLRRYKIRIGLASGASRQEVAHSLHHHAIAAYFEAVCTKEDVMRNKPAPDVYQLSCHRLGVAPKACLAIEDSDTGQQSATAAGLLCVRVTQTPAAGRPEVATLEELTFSVGSD